MTDLTGRTEWAIRATWNGHQTIHPRPSEESAHYLAAWWNRRAAAGIRPAPTCVVVRRDVVALASRWEEMP